MMKKKTYINLYYRKYQIRQEERKIFFVKLIFHEEKKNPSKFNYLYVPQEVAKKNDNTYQLK